MTVDIEKYLDFVHDVTSTESLDYAALLTRMNKLELEDDCNLSQLLTAALGLTAESGEFTEIVRGNNQIFKSWISPTYKK